MKGRSLLVISLIPGQFLIQFALKKLGLMEDPKLALGLNLALALIVSGLVLFLRWELYRKDLAIFRENRLKNLGLAIFGGLMSALIIGLTKKFIVGNFLSPVEEYSLPSGGYLLLSGLIPALAPISEEMVFRHELYYNLREKGLGEGLLMVLSSLAFGLIHLGNYGGNFLLTLPIVAVGFFYCLIYRYSKNIITTSLAHFFYNGSLALLPALVIIISEILA